MNARHRPIPPTTFPATRLGLLVGVALGLGGAALHTKAPPPPPPIAQVPPSPLAAQPALQGAEPAPLTAMPQGPVVVNVWLQGCADCMPKFEAWKRLRVEHRLDGMRIANVAYGSATREFATRYRVDDTLGLDVDGSVLVRRLGIGTFTTLVVDGAGRVTWQGDPTSRTFETELWTAWAAVTGGALPQRALPFPSP